MADRFWGASKFQTGKMTHQASRLGQKRPVSESPERPHHSNMDASTLPPLQRALSSERESRKFSPLMTDVLGVQRRGDRRSGDEKPKAVQK